MPRSIWTTPRLPDLVGVSGAAEILGVDRRTILRWCQAGSGSYGASRTRMPPWALLDASPGERDGADEDATKVWTRRDVERLAATRSGAPTTEPQERRHREQRPDHGLVADDKTATT